jgi:hypothetical protein
MKRKPQDLLDRHTAEPNVDIRLGVWNPCGIYWGHSYRF